MKYYECVECRLCPDCAREMGVPDISSVTFADNDGAEVYVYVRGQLVMKRWLKTGASVVFNVAPVGTQWNEPDESDFAEDSGIDPAAEIAYLLTGQNDPIGGKS